MTFAYGIAVAVFVGTYVLLVAEKMERTVAALAGAVLLLLFGVINQEQAIHGIDFNTLGLLIGMMVIVGIAKNSGMFQFVALWACKVGKGQPLPVFALLISTTAIFSALLDNVTTVLLMTPVMFVVANNLGISPMPLMVGAILLSNIGGTATLIGDPPNIMIGSAAGLSFNDFLVHLAPIAAICSVVTIGMLALVYRGQLVAAPDAAERVAKFRPEAAIEDPKLLRRSLAVIGLVLVGFFTHSWTGLEGATIALGGGALLILLSHDDPEHTLREVEWGTIFFFLGLFVLVTGLEHVGAIEQIADLMLRVTGGDPTVTTLSLLWASAVFSAVVDNIPFVATMIPLIEDLGRSGHMDVGPLWWALALGADIGGNATLVGASANVVVSGLAAKHGQPIGFWAYARVAIPLTTVSIALCHVYLWLRYL